MRTPSHATLLLAGLLSLACGPSTEEPLLLTGPLPEEYQPLEVEAWARCGRQVRLRVRHEGGCKPHRYALHWRGGLLMSKPPQVPLTALHAADGDTCTKPVTRTLVYDAARGPDSWQQGEAEPLIVHADGRFMEDRQVECGALP